MTGGWPTLTLNARWELTRLQRSRRLWLLLIPPIAAPVGSSIADVYLQVPSSGTAIILGLLIAGGLSALVLLDLSALTVGEDLQRRTFLALFPLPQDRRVALAGRLFPSVGGALLAYFVAAGAIWFVGGAFVSPGGPVHPPLFAPLSLLLALPALLLALGGITALGAVITQSPSEALVAGVLGGVVVAGGIGFLINRGEVSWLVPVALGVGGVGALVAAVLLYPSRAV